jgi:hypothetical protein
MTDTMPRVGLDVHANQTHLFSLDVVSGEFVRKRIEGPPTEALSHLQALGPRSIAVYEAGPTGFGLARAGAELGLDIRIAAPGLSPRRRPIASRPTAATAATQSASLACSLPRRCTSCVCRASPKSASAT